MSGSDFVASGSDFVVIGSTGALAGSDSSAPKTGPAAILRETVNKSVLASVLIFAPAMSWIKTHATHAANAKFRQISQFAWGRRHFFGSELRSPNLCDALVMQNNDSHVYKIEQQ
jgi:hypothetical protein